MAGGGEAAHVDPDLGDDDLGGDAADPGDLIQLVGRRGKRGQFGVDLGLHRGDVGAGLVDAADHRLQQEGVMVAEPADEGLLQLRGLFAQAGAGQVGQHLGVAFPGDQRGQHRPAGDPKMSEATTLSLIWASSSSFSTRFFSAVRALMRSAR